MEISLAGSFASGLFPFDRWWPTVPEFRWAFVWSSN